MSILNRKSREELEIETQMHIKLLKKKAEDFAKKCDEMAAKYEVQSKTAREIGNQNLEQVFRDKSRNLKLQSSKIRSFILIVDDIGMMKDQSSLMNSFADTMKTYVKTIGKGSANAQWMTQMESQLDQAMNESDKVGDLFGGLLQDVGLNLNKELDMVSGSMDKQEGNENQRDPLDKVQNDMKKKITNNNEEVK